MLCGGGGGCCCGCCCAFGGTAPGPAPCDATMVDVGAGWMVVVDADDDAEVVAVMNDDVGIMGFVLIFTANVTRRSNKSFVNQCWRWPAPTAYATKRSAQTHLEYLPNSDAFS